MLMRQVGNNICFATSQLGKQGMLVLSANKFANKHVEVAMLRSLHDNILGRAHLVVAGMENQYSSVDV
jgi:hypothetical protein